MKTSYPLQRIDPNAGNRSIVRYTTIVRPRRRSARWTLLWRWLAGLLLLLLVIGVAPISLFLVQTHLLPQRSVAVQPIALAAPVRDLSSPSLLQAPTATPQEQPSRDLFAAPVATPTPLPNNSSAINPIFSLPTADGAQGLPQLIPTAASSTGDAADPLVSAAKQDPQLYRAFLSAHEALEQADPEQAVATLVTLAQNHPAYLTVQVTELLYTAYLAAGDQQMRAGDRAAAVDFYSRAQGLPLQDQSALTRRLESMARFNSVITTASAATAVAPALPVAAAPTAVAVQEPVATATLASPEVASLGVASLGVAAPDGVSVAATCPNPNVTITAPAANTTVTGAVGLLGSATNENLWFYKLEWAAAGSDTFAYFAGSRSGVTNGWLGNLDTTTLVNGDYLIRLTVVDMTGNYPTPCDLPLRVAN